MVALSSGAPERKAAVIIYDEWKRGLEKVRKVIRTKGGLHQATRVRNAPRYPINCVLATPATLQVQVTWAIQPENEYQNRPTAMEVWRKYGAQDWALLATLSGTATTHLDTTILASGVLVGYKVRAKNSAGDSEFSNDPVILTI